MKQTFLFFKFLPEIWIMMKIKLMCSDQWTQWDKSQVNVS